MEPVADHPGQEVARERLQIRGIVQGVGFRPLVYRLAVEHDLCGYIANQLGDVTIEMEGNPHRIAQFQQALLRRTLPPARIDRLDREALPPVGYTAFRIIPSGAMGSSAPVLPPDLALCPACRSDITDPTSRYYLYPFTCCVDCGPRYTVTRSLPYDRPATSMGPFRLCDGCHAEYEEPLSRRFHAQTICCARCGPQVELLAADRTTRLVGNWHTLIQQALGEGQILALKGLGGFHLICDAAQQAAVERLRTGKNRPHKPFALMVRDAHVAAQYFDLSPAELALLQSRRAPILLATPRPALVELLPVESLARGYQRIGLMLPYTPLHLLLFAGPLRFLVVTSGNRSGLPIARTNEEALEQLSGVADLFALHNREILTRVEDSVCQVVAGSTRLIRRSRGYVAEAISVPVPPGASREGPVILAVGAEQSNSFCLLQGDQALLGPYMGDLDSAQHLASWWEGLRHMRGLLQSEPRILAYDPHPGYLISQEAARTFAHLKQIPVYHHHAHLAACMAEHGLREPVIGSILDGTGFGRDESLWGFETLVGDYLDFQRIAHLRPILLPGGEAAIRQPWLVAAALYHEMVQDPTQTEEWARRRFPEHQTHLPFVMAQLTGKIDAPRASSAGRLFDGVAAILGLCTLSTYEGEAASLLGEQALMPAGQMGPGAERNRYGWGLDEGYRPGLAGAELAAVGVAESALAQPGLDQPDLVYPVICQDGEWQTAPLLRGLLHDLHQAVPLPVMARRFHHSIAEMVCRGALLARQITGLNTVVLGGGVWQNRYLLSVTSQLLAQQGFHLFSPQQLPPGDGGIALGQALSALWRWHRDVSSRSSEGP